MKNNRNVLIVVALVFTFLFAKKFIFFDDEQKILRRMETLSLLLTKNKGQSVLVVAQKIKQSIAFFEAPLVIHLDYEEGLTRKISIQDKERLRESISGFKFRYGWVIVSFEETQVELSKETASTTGRVRLEFESKEQGPVFDHYNVFMKWKKVDEEWFIKDVDLSLVELEE